MTEPEPAQRFDDLPRVRRGGFAKRVGVPSAGIITLIIVLNSIGLQGQVQAGIALILGVDRILFSVDYPFVMNPPGVEWMESIHLNNEDKDKILHGNAKQLLKL